MLPLCLHARRSRFNPWHLQLGMGKATCPQTWISAASTEIHGLWPYTVWDNHMVIERRGGLHQLRAVLLPPVVLPPNLQPREVHDCAKAGCGCCTIAHLRVTPPRSGQHCCEAHNHAETGYGTEWPGSIESTLGVCFFGDIFSKISKILLCAPCSIR